MLVYGPILSQRYASVTNTSIHIDKTEVKRSVYTVELNSDVANIKRIAQLAVNLN